MNASIDDADPIICEPCGRASDATTEDMAMAAGWKLGWDGWVCPSCDKEDDA